MGRPFVACFRPLRKLHLTNLQAHAGWGRAWVDLVQERIRKGEIVTDVTDGAGGGVSPSNNFQGISLVAAAHGSCTGRAGHGDSAKSPFREG